MNEPNCPVYARIQSRGNELFITKDFDMKSFSMLSSLVVTLVLSTAAHGGNAPVSCYIQAYDGHYLTAVEGGGRAEDSIHTDATQARAWEKFTLVDANRGTSNITYGIRTMKGYYLTAVDGGGRTQNVIHSNATQIRGWEEFQLESLGGGYYAIKTFRGYYLTAVDSGGRITQVMHSDAKRVGRWERFKFTCGKAK